MLKDLFQKYVKFRIGKGKYQYGLVVSIDQGILNIKGIEQSSRERPLYHLTEGEVTECSHKEVFNLGFNLNQG